MHNPVQLSTLETDSLNTVPNVSGSARVLKTRDRKMIEMKVVEASQAKYDHLKMPLTRGTWCTL